MYDIIIVGGGPAGSAAAKIFKDNSINFCVIDKSKFPREKLCGGGLTNKSTLLLKKLDLKIDGCQSSPTNSVSIFGLIDNNLFILIIDGSIKLITISQKFSAVGLPFRSTIITSLSLFVFNVSPITPLLNDSHVLSL